MPGVLASSLCSLYLLLAPTGTQHPNPRLPGGQHLPELHQQMGFLLPQNRNLTEGKKLLADTSLHLKLLWKNWENITAHANNQGLVEKKAGGQKKGDHMEIHKGFKSKFLEQVANS